MNYSKADLKEISNYISKQVGRHLGRVEFLELIDLLKQLPFASDVSKDAKLERIFEAFINRHEKVPDELPTATNMDLDRENPIADYMQRQFAMITQDENPLKFNMRRQNVSEGLAYAEKDGNLTWKSLEPPVIKPPLDRVADSLKTIEGYFHPTSYDDVKKNASLTWVSYGSIMLIERKIVFDSRFRQVDAYDPNIFRWYINQTQNSNTIGFIRIPPLHEIKRIDGYRFTLPFLDAQQLDLGTVKVRFNEMCKDSYGADLFNQDQRVRRDFNLSYSVESITGNRARLIPNPAQCTFNVPTTTLESLTLEFLGPDGPIAMPVCLVQVTITAGNPTLLTLVAHGLVNGDLVFFNNVYSDNPSVQAQIIRLQGWQVTVLTPDTFTIPVDSTAVIFTSTLINMCINKFRFILEIGLLCLE